MPSLSSYFFYFLHLNTHESECEATHAVKARESSERAVSRMQFFQLSGLPAGVKKVIWPERLAGELCVVRS
jgi:hypothetical protein